jgi:hypothetical protein
MARHGEERNFRQEVSHGPAKELIDATSGEVVYRGSLYSHERPVGERYCDNCKAWKTQKGILASLFGCPDCKAEW